MLELMDKKPLPSMYTVNEIAEHFSVSRETVFRWIAKGHLRPVKLPGRAVRIEPEELERFKREGGREDSEVLE